MSRHPYTNACDYVRSLAGYNEGGTILCRSDASQVIQGISSVIGMTYEELATKLSLYYQEKQNEIDEKSVEDFQIAQGVK